MKLIILNGRKTCLIRLAIPMNRKHNPKFNIVPECDFFPNFAWLVTSQHYCSSSQTFLIKLLSGWHNRCKPQVSFLHFPMAYQDTQTDLPVFLLLLCPICSFSPPYLGLTAFLKCFASYHICTAFSFIHAAYSRASKSTHVMTACYVQRGLGHLSAALGHKTKMFHSEVHCHE